MEPCPRCGCPAWVGLLIDCERCAAEAERRQQDQWLEDADDWLTFWEKDAR